MNLGLVFSVLLHSAVVALAVFGLPRLARDEPVENRLIVVDVVTVAEVTNAPPPAETVQPDKTPPPPPQASEAPDRVPPPPPPSVATPPPPPPPPPQTAALPPEPAPPPVQAPSPAAEPAPSPAAEPAPPPAVEPAPPPAAEPAPPAAVEAAPPPEPAPAADAVPVPVEKPTPEEAEREPAELAALAPPPEPVARDRETPEAAEVERAEPEPPAPLPVSRPTPPRRPAPTEVREAPQTPDEPEPEKQDNFLNVLKTVQDLKKQAPRRAAETETTPVPEAETTARRANFDPNQKLSVSELDAIRQQISGCWLVPAGAKNAADLVVEIEVMMNSDRTVRSARVVDQSRMLNDPFFRSAAESALRALKAPKCSPLQLPPEKYDTWKSFTITFDPKDMLS